MKQKIIKTTDLAKAIGMSDRNIRRYESCEMFFKFIKGSMKKEKQEILIKNAKIGLLVEVISDPKINTELLEKYGYNKSLDGSTIDELKRLANVGEHIGSWYLSDEIKNSLIK